jgi:hypothetical protein
MAFGVPKVSLGGTVDEIDGHETTLLRPRQHHPVFEGGRYKDWLVVLVLSGEGEAESLSY